VTLVTVLWDWRKKKRQVAAGLYYTGEGWVPQSRPRRELGCAVLINGPVCHAQVSFVLAFIATNAESMLRKCKSDDLLLLTLPA